MMKTWQDDQLDALIKADSVDTLIAKLTEAAKGLGFDYVAYGAQMPIPVSRQTTALVNTYPTKWQERYQERRYLAIDPTVHHGLRSCLPLAWSDRLFAATPELWSEARQAGLRAGWSQASRDASGVVGMLSLARDGEPVTRSELDAKGAPLAWLANFVHVGMLRFLLPRHCPESQALLTQREQEVLRWTAEGKTAYEIGQILAVSERTVNFHINNVVGKLGASNKTQAAVKAALLGMLD